MAGVVGEFRSAVNGDVAYGLDVARRILAGATLYTSLIDLNPPFIFWLSLPAAATPSPVTAYRIVTIGLALAMLAAAWPLTWRQPFLRAGYLLAALALPLGSFGEREHLLFLLMFPFVALSIFRSDGSWVPQGRAWVIGLLAGLGLLLKPTAALLPVLIFVDAAVTLGWRETMRRPELWAIIEAGVLGVLAVVFFAPEYLSVVRAYGPLYAEFARVPVRDLLFRDIYPLSGWIALLVVGTAMRWTRNAVPLRLLMWCILASLVGAVVQGKGFSYHYLPVLGFSVMALLLLAFSLPAEEHSPWPLRVAGSLGLLIVLALPLATLLHRVSGERDTLELDRALLSARLGGSGPGTSVAMLSVRLGDAYPLILERGWHQALAFPSLWFTASTGDTARIGELQDRVIHDIATGAPALLIERAPTYAERRAGDRDIDYLQLLRARPGARAALAPYVKREHVAGYDIYLRAVRR